MSARRPPGRVNMGIVVIGLLMTMPFVVLLARSFGRDPHAVPSVMVDKPMPTYVMEDLDGNRVELEDLQGELVVLNFWSTTCQPCKIEHPHLQRAALLYPEVKFYGVLYNDDAAKAKAYLKRAGTTYPHLTDDGGVLGVELGVAGVPETFFIDRSGTIREKYIGPLSPEAIAYFLRSM